MTDRDHTHPDLDDLDLLGLIEDEIEPDRAEAVRAALAADPRRAAMVELMREDRAALQSIPMVEAPADIMERVESALDDQPTVMTHPPGELRRAQARRERARLWSRLAAAAVVLIAGGGGLIAIAVALSGSGSSDTPLAMIEPGRPVATEAAAAAPDRLAVQRPEPPGASVAAPDDRTGAAIRAPGMHVKDGGVEPAGNGRPRQADFAIVVVADNAEDVEEALATALGRLDAAVALVRNFSEPELRAMLQGQLAGVNATRNDGTRLTAGVGADRVVDPLATPAPGGRPTARPRTSDAAVSALLVGSPQLAPTIEDQLGLSESGATHTVTLPASAIPALLIELNETLEASRVLRPLEAAGGPDGGGGETHVLLRWAIELPRVRASAEQLQDDDGDALVMLPVVIRSGGATPDRR